MIVFVELYYLLIISILAFCNNLILKHSINYRKFLNYEL